MYYMLLLIGFIVGQLLFMAICSYYLQKDLPNIEYIKAFKIFFNKEFGGFVVALCFVFVLLFVLPDFINLNLTKQQLMEKENLTKVEQAQVYFRSLATLLGIFGQWIPFIVYKRGKKAIVDYSNKNGLDTSSIPQINKN